MLALGQDQALKKLFLKSDGDVGIGYSGSIAPPYGTTSPTILIIKPRQQSSDAALRLARFADDVVGLDIWADGGSGTHDSYFDNRYELSDWIFRSGTRGVGTIDEVMRVTGEGNVGIGTTAPEYPLHISSADSAIYLVGSDQGRIILQDTGATSNSQAFDIVSKEDKLHFRRLNNGRDSVQATVMALSGDKVGIGTTAPDTKLHVLDSAAPGVSPYNSTGLTVENNGRANIHILHPNGSDGYLFFGDANAGNRAYVGHYGSAQSPANQMVFYSAGNFEFANGKVGIGTTAPGAKLHVYNTSATSDGDGSASETLSGQDSILLYGHDGTNGQTYGSITWTGGATRRRAMIAAVAESTDQDFVGLAFYTRGTDGPGDFFESMRIAHSGDVGIGIPAVADMGGKLNVGERGGGTADINIGIDNNNRTMLTYNGGKLTIGTRYSSTNYFDTLTVQSGKVGIGTTSPSSKLTIDAGNVEIRNGYDLMIRPSGNGNDFRLTALDTGGGDVVWGGATTTSIMRWANNGNVGIGTTAPAHQLTLCQSAPELGFYDTQGSSRNWVIRTGDAAVGDFSIKQSNAAGGNPVSAGTRIFYLSPSGAMTTDGAAGAGYHAVKDNGTLSGYFGSGNSLSTGGTGANTDLACRAVGKLAFLTNNASAAKMTILTDGNVGIGTTAPTRKLDVYGDTTNWCANFRCPTDGYGVTIGNRLSNGTGYAAHLFWDNGDAGYFSIQPYSYTNSAVRGLVLCGGGGNVGIGTTSPAAPLHVLQTSGDDNDTGLIVETTNGSERARILLRSGSAIEDFVFNLNSTGMHFGFSSSVQAINVKSDGNVGIGANLTAPANLLHVYGSLPVFIQNTQGATAATLAEASTIYALKIQNRATGGHLTFSGTSAYTTIQALSSNSAAASNILLNAFGGKVGIGVFGTPAQLLHVEGTARIKPSSIGYFDFQANGSYAVRMTNPNGNLSLAGGKIFLEYGSNNSVTATIDGATGNVLIGSSTSNLTYNKGLQITSASNVANLKLKSGSSTGLDLWQDTGGNGYIINHDNAPIYLKTNGASTLTLNANGTSNFYGSVTLANDKILAIGTGAGNAGSIRIFDNSSTSRFMEWEPVGTSDAYFRFNGGTSYASPYRTYFNQQHPSGGHNVYVDGDITSMGTGRYIYAENLNVSSYKNFEIEHPTKENMMLVHSSLEGPEAGVYYRGRAQSDTITLPDYWTGLVRDGTITVQLTPNGSFQHLYVVSTSLTEIKIGAAEGETIDCYYVIYGERADVASLIVEDADAWQRFQERKAAMNDGKT